MILTVHYLYNITGPTFLPISLPSSPCSTRYASSNNNKVFHVDSLFFFVLSVGEDEKKKTHPINSKIKC